MTKLAHNYVKLVRKLESNGICMTKFTHIHITTLPATRNCTLTHILVTFSINSIIVKVSTFTFFYLPIFTYTLTLHSLNLFL